MYITVTMLLLQRKNKMTATSYDVENKLCKFMNIQEEHEFYNEICDRIIANPRYYLDNLDELSVFRVSFIRYSANKTKAL